MKIAILKGDFNEELKELSDMMNANRQSEIKREGEELNTPVFAAGAGQPASGGSKSNKLGFRVNNVDLKGGGFPESANSSNGEMSKGAIAYTDVSDRVFIDSKIGRSVDDKLLNSPMLRVSDRIQGGAVVIQAKRDFCLFHPRRQQEP